MTNIVERLRVSCSRIDCKGGCKVCTERDAADEIEQLRKRVPSWQPIETAPKPDLDDWSVSRYILGFVPETDCSPVDAKSQIDVVWWEPKIRGGCWYSSLDMPIKPTHWMPLPQPPEGA